MNVKDPLEGYEPISKEAAAMTKFLYEVWEKLGKPDDCSTEAGWTMVDSIIKAWSKSYPQEVSDLITENKEALSAERSVSQSVSKGGIFALAYPERLFQLLKVLLPKQHLNDKEFYTKFIRRYPIFKTSNYA